MAARLEKRREVRSERRFLSVLLSALIVVPNNPLVASAAAQMLGAAESAAHAGGEAASGSVRLIVPLSLDMAPPAPSAADDGVAPAVFRGAAAAPAATVAPAAPTGVLANPSGPGNAPTNPMHAPTRGPTPGAPQAPQALTPDSAGQDGRTIFDGAGQHDGADARQSVPMESVPGRRTGLRSLSSPPQKKPVYVMAPLEYVTDWNLFDKQLSALKANGVVGLSSDVWWGKFQKSENSFDWRYYLKYAAAVRRAGLRWDPILSFHQCGGNVGDTCDEPLPKWLGRYADQDTKFIDKNGFANGEYLAFWFEGAYPHYDAAMASFAENFASYADIISKIQISLGPAGELRYPSYYSAAGWSYPQRGRLQFYSSGAKSSFRNYISRKYGTLDALNLAWGTTLASFDQAEPPSDDDSLFQTETPLSRDFFSWYQNVLERHLARMMAIAHERLGPKFPARFGGKMSGVHWLYNSPVMPHAAEKSAGYVDYDRLIAQFKESGADLTFTAVEMDDRDSARDPFYSAPQTLLRQVASSAKNLGVAIDGENALPITNDESRYRNINDALVQGIGGFTLVRLGQIVDSAGVPTSEMAPFVRNIVEPAAATASERTRDSENP